MLCIFSMHFENVPALQSLINQILLYSYRKVCAHFLIQLFDLSERRRSAGKKGLQGRWNRKSKDGPCPVVYQKPKLSAEKESFQLSVSAFEIKG